MATALVKSGDAPFFSFVNCQRWDYTIFLKKIHKRNIEYWYNSLKGKRQEVCFDGKDENTGGR